MSSQVASFRIKSDLRKSFKSYCVMHDISMSDSLEYLIIELIKGNIAVENIKKYANKG